MLKHTTAPTEVKAAGGVRDLEKLIKVKEMGVTRVGASATAAILDPARKQLGLEKIVVTNDTSTSGY